MWESRLLLARFPRGSWKEWEALLAFHAFHSPGISTAHSDSGFGRRAAVVASLALGLVFRLLILLGVLHSVARDV